MVKPEEMPKSWGDLANPRWKGRILSDDTRAIGGGYLYFFVTFFNQAFGEKYHQAMAQQALSFTRNQREAQRRVARVNTRSTPPLSCRTSTTSKVCP